MADKFFLVVILALLLTGLYTVNSYMVTDEGGTPLGSLVEYAGTANSERKEALRIELEKKTFDYQSRFHFAQVQQKIANVEQTRAALVAVRRQRLRELMNYAGAVQGSAEVDIVALQARRRQFLDQVPDVDALDVALKRAVQMEDAQRRMLEYDRIKDAFLRPLKAFAPRLTGYEEEFHRRVEEVEQPISVSLDAVPEECQPLVFCLERRVAILKEILLSYHDTYLQAPQQDLKMLVHLLRLFQYENQMLFMKYEENEKTFEANNRQFEAHFQTILQQMSTATETDLTDLLSLYYEIESEYSQLVEILRFNEQQLTRIHSKYIHQIHEIMERVSNNPLWSFDAVTEAYAAFEGGRKDNLEQFFKDESMGRQLLEERRDEYTDFIIGLAALLNVDLIRFVEDRVYHQEKTAGYIAARTAAGKAPPAARNPFLLLTSEEHEREVRRRSRQLKREELRQYFNRIQENGQVAFPETP